MTDTIADDIEIWVRYQEKPLKIGLTVTVDDQVHIFGTALRAWVAFNLQDRVDSRRLGLVLRSIGAEPISITNGDGRRAAWKLPRKIWGVK